MLFIQSFRIYIYIYIIDINPSVAGLQTKGKFACPVCGPKVKSRRSKILGKEVFDEYRNFLSKNHKYRTTEKIFSMGNKKLD
jgi:hypothetical protein